MGPGISGTERMQDSLCPGVGAERGMIIAFVLVLTASVGYERLWDWPLFGRDTGECLRSVLSWIGYCAGHMAGGKFNDRHH